jgi:antirestriction protein ArdC
MASKTTKTTKNGKSREQRQAEREALLAQLGDKVSALAISAEWLAYLRFVSAFRHYSFNNLLSIAAQCPHATPVAGYRKWQELGRQVRKGERAIKILGYSTKKITTTDPTTGEEVEDRVVRYPVLSVFDISQTDGDPIPTDSYQLPTGDGPAGALDKLTTWLTDEGWTVREKSLAGRCEGYTDHQDRVIVTNTGLEPAARLAVLLHEAAHAILHSELAPGEYQAHRGLCETEAESVAYVLANLLGLDTDASSISYVAGWSQTDPAVLATAATNVLRAVNTIAAGLGLDSHDDQDDDVTGEPTAA